MLIVQLIGGKIGYTQTQDEDPVSIEGKAILVTGAGSGLGAALCKLLASSGANVMMAELQPNKALDVAETLRGGRGKVQAVECDVGDVDSARRAIDETIASFGRIDVLSNNAGTDVTCAIEELSFEQWDRVMHTNLYGTFLLSQAAAPHMKRSGRNRHAHRGPVRTDQSPAHAVDGAEPRPASRCALPQLLQEHLPAWP
ncbi:MAG: SDR family NAD(P)-dependent oxidoreductase [Burkholderiaceae bacterium]